MANTEQQPVQNNAQVAFFEKNKKAILIALVAIVLIIVGIFVYNSKVAAPREDKASTALAKYQDLFDNEQYAEAQAGFVQVANDFKGTDAANLANLYTGLCYANQEQWAEAVTYLEKYSAGSDAMISPAATAALGNAYANTGNVDKAVKTLKKAAKLADKQSINKANISFSATYMIQAGVLLESQDKWSEALSIYKEVKSKYVNAQQVQSKEIDKYITRAEAKL